METSFWGNMLCSIEGVILACAITERGDKFNLSIRSQANGLAEKYGQMLGGGGHPDAAGARIFKKQKEVEKIVIKTAKELLQGIK